MAILKLVLFVALFKLCFGVVTEQDLQKQLGVDVKALKEVTWKEWVNNNKQVSIRYPPPEPCRKPSGKGSSGYKECCNSTSPCTSKFLECFHGTCNCKAGYFVNDNNDGCENRPKKELGQKCAIKDNCYAAYATCQKGKCVCKDGFVRSKQTCKPIEYDCPYKKPALFRGSIRSCIENPNANPTVTNYSPCPANYSCLAAFGTRPKFLTASGVEESYCCPPVPNILVPTKEPFARPQKVFQDVCFYGKASNGSNPDMGCPPGHYYFAGIGLGPACCPDPCLPHPTIQAVIINGKCTYSREKGS